MEKFIGELDRSIVDTVLVSIDEIRTKSPQFADADDFYLKKIKDRDAY